MYLSRLILNPMSRRVQRELAAPYEMHRTVMRAFPDGLVEGEERVLFRVDIHAATQAPLLLVQSWGLPDWSCLAEAGARGYLLPLDQPNPAIKAFDLKLAGGQTLAFRLLANPTVKQLAVEGAKAQPKRRGLYREEEQLAWLARKAAAGGFRLLSAQTNHGDKVGGFIERKEEGKTHQLTVLAVRFDGLLQVVDPDRLWATVRCGIGSAKGMGCGLLSLAPAG